MSEHEKTRPDTAIPERVEMGTGIEQTSASHNDFTTSPPVRQMRVSDFLGHGQESAVPLRHLKEMTGLPGRTIRLMIEQERRVGVPLLSDNKRGYYMAASTQERDQFVKSMRARAYEILRTASAVERGG